MDNIGNQMSTAQAKTKRTAKRPETKNARISVRVEPSLRRRVERLAAAEGRKMPWVVIQALNQYLAA